MIGNKKRRKPIPVNNGVHRVPVEDRSCLWDDKQLGWSEKPFYGHKRAQNMVIRQGDMVLATFLDYTKDGYKLHNHPAFVISTNRSLTDTNRVWVLPMYRKPSLGFNGEASVPVTMEECEGLRTDGYLSVNQFQNLPVKKVIKKIGSVETDRVFNEVVRKLLDQFGIKIEDDRAILPMKGWV